MPLSRGEPAPAFEAPDQNGDTVDSEALRGQRFVLYFYPKDDTPICTRQACAFRDALDEFRSLDVQVIGVSSDGSSSHARFDENHGLGFRLLADTDGKLMEAYDAKGLLGRPKRVTYLIGPDGRVEGAYRNELSGKKHAEWVRERLAAVAELS